MEFKWWLVFILALMLIIAIREGFEYDNETKRIDKCIQAGMEYVDGDCVSTFR